MNIVEEIFDRAGAKDIAILNDDAALSFGDLDRLSADVAAGLKKHIHQSGVRVGLLCPDGFDYVVIAIAVLRAGYCLVPIACELAVAEKEDLLERTALAVVIDHRPRRHLSLADSVLSVLEDIKLLNVEVPAWDTELRQLNPAFIRFSSGTTGNRKGVVISHETLRDRVCVANASLRVGRGDRVLWVLPMAHHFAVSLMLYLWHGATAVLPASHLAAEILDAAIKHRVTVFYAAPFHFQVLAVEPSQREWPELRLAVSTAAKLDVCIAEKFQQRYGVAPSQALGIIEVGLPVSNIADPVGHPQSVGLPQPDFEIDLRDKNGMSVATGCSGELFLRGPGVFDAYLHPWKLRKDVLEEGWFRTGDIGVCDQEGFLTLQGRTHSVLNIAGMKCFPEEVEEVLCAHPAVVDARVIGRKHGQFGAVPVAEIVCRSEIESPSKRDLLQHCRNRLSGYKIPVDFLIIDSIPRTPSGKIKRR